MKMTEGEEEAVEYTRENLRNITVQCLVYVYMYVGCVMGMSENIAIFFIKTITVKVAP